MYRPNMHEFAWECNALQEASDSHKLDVFKDLVAILRLVRSIFPSWTSGVRIPSPALKGFGCRFTRHPSPFLILQRGSRQNLFPRVQRAHWLKDWLKKLDSVTLQAAFAANEVARIIVLRRAEVLNAGAAYLFDASRAPPDGGD